VRTLKGKFNAKPVHLTPVLISLLVGVLCTFLVIESSIDLYSAAPFPEGIGSLGNGLYFVILAGIGASLLYLLMKRKNLRLIALITGFALTTATFLVSTVYLYALLTMYYVPYETALVLVLAILITVVADYEIFRTNGIGNSLTIMLLGGSLGAFLGKAIPTLSAVLILSFLAVYDVFAVYRGPVGKMAREGLEQLRGLSVSFKDVQIGLGDLTFYSMLVSLVLSNAGPIFCAASAIGILSGAFLAFKLLEKKGMFPGLPFSVALGLTPLIIWLVL
jgi:presenilin-like A22 family membrane protease